MVMAACLQHTPEEIEVPLLEVVGHHTEHLSRTVVHTIGVTRISLSEAVLPACYIPVA